MNPTNTVFDAKRLIGRKVKDASVQADMKHWPFKIIAGPADKPMLQGKASILSVHCHVVCCHDLHGGPSIATFTMTHQLLCFLTSLVLEECVRCHVFGLCVSCSGHCLHTCACLVELAVGDNVRVRLACTVLSKLDKI